MPSTNPCSTSSTSPTNKEFKCPDYEKIISSTLRTFYKKKEFFDVILTTQSDKCQVLAHRIVLSAMSKYFYDQFSGPMAEHREITLMQINGTTLRSIVNFMYMGSIHIRIETVDSLLRAASTFQINILIEACWEFLRRNINVSNCLFIAFLAEEYNNIEIYSKAFVFACDHFEMFCDETQFLNLHESQVIRLISSDDINVRSETTVFHSVLAWITFERPNRDKWLVHLLSHVRYEWLTAKFIIKNMPLLCEGECCDLISNWLQWHNTPGIRPQLPLKENIPRKSYEKLGLVTWNSAGFIVQTFDQKSNSWVLENIENCQVTRPERSEYICEVLFGKMFLCGGIIDGSVTNSVEYIDIKKQKFNSLPPMKTARRLPGLMACDGCLFAVGGYDSDAEVLALVERYDFNKCRWEFSAPLPRRFECKRLAYSNRLLYVLGRDKTMLCYDPTVNEWSERTYPTDKSRFIDVRGCLYAFGGRGHDIQCYDPSTDIWKVTGSSLSIEGLESCTSFRNRLVYLGNREDGPALYKYNPETNETTNLIQPILSDDINWYYLFTL